MGYNCNANDYLASATLNGVPLSGSAALDTGPQGCGCTADATSERATIGAADVQRSYNIQGTNLITFNAPSQYGIYTYSTNTYALIVVHL